MNIHSRKTNDVLINGVLVKYYTGLIFCKIDVERMNAEISFFHKHKALKTKHGYLIQDDRGNVFDADSLLSKEVAQEAIK